MWKSVLGGFRWSHMRICFRLIWQNEYGPSGRLKENKQHRMPATHSDDEVGSFFQRQRDSPIPSEFGDILN